MPRGGPRESAGRKPGARNRKTEEQIRAVQEGGLTPLEYLLSVMRNDELELSDRIEAAKSAAPYVHPRLASIEHAGKGGGPIQISIINYADSPPA